MTSRNPRSLARPVESAGDVRRGCPGTPAAGGACPTAARPAARAGRSRGTSRTGRPAQGSPGPPAHPGHARLDLHPGCRRRSSSSTSYSTAVCPWTPSVSRSRLWVPREVREGVLSEQRVEPLQAEGPHVVAAQVQHVLVPPGHRLGQEPLRVHPSQVVGRQVREPVHPPGPGDRVTAAVVAATAARSGTYAKAVTAS